MFFPLEDSEDQQLVVVLVLCHSGMVMVLFQWRVSYPSNAINQNVCHAIGWCVFMAALVVQDENVKCVLLYGVSECVVSLSCLCFPFACWWRKCSCRCSGGN